METFAMILIALYVLYNLYQIEEGFRVKRKFNWKHFKWHGIILAIILVIALLIDGKLFKSFSDILIG